MKNNKNKQTRSLFAFTEFNKKSTLIDFTLKRKYVLIIVFFYKPIIYSNKYKGKK